MKFSQNTFALIISIQIRLVLNFSPMKIGVGKGDERGMAHRLRPEFPNPLPH